MTRVRPTCASRSAPDKVILGGQGAIDEHQDRIARNRLPGLLVEGVALSIIGDEGQALYPSSSPPEGITTDGDSRAHT